MSTNRNAFGLLILGGVMLAGCIALAKESSTLGVPPVAAVFWQAVGGSLILGTLSYWRRSLPSFLNGHWKYHLITSVTYITIPSTVVFLCGPHLPSGFLSVITVLSALFTLLFVVILKSEPLNMLRVIGLLVGFAGTVLILARRMDYGAEVSFGWALFSLLIPLGYAFTNVYRKKYWPRGQNALGLSFAMMLVTIPLIWVPLFFTDGFYVPFRANTPGDIYLVAYVLLYNFYIVIALEIIRLAGAIFMSQINYVVAVAGTIMGAVIFGERPGHWVYLAMILILSGVATVSIATQRDNNRMNK